MSYFMKDISTPYNFQQWSSSLNELGYKWLLGNGKNILFWEDRWLEESLLADKFPRLYSLSRWKFYNVEIFLKLWKIDNASRWTRSLRSRESDQEEEVVDLVLRIELRQKKILYYGNKVMTSSLQGGATSLLKALTISDQAIGRKFGNESAS